MIRNLTKKTVVSYRTRHAVSFRDRLRGMIGHSFASIEADAMVFSGCSCVHTFFMSFPLDLIFLGRENTVLRVAAACPPWRFAVWCIGAHFVIELPSGSAAHSGTEPGDKLDLYAEALPQETKTRTTNHSIGERQAVFPSKENTTI